MPHEASVEAGGAAADERPQILIVEDNETNAFVLCAMLRKHGYAAAVATDGLQGVRLSRKLRPRLVLMDLHMPHVDGFAAAAAIRDAFAGEAPAIVAVTANASPEVHAACLAMGFREVLSKPVLLSELIGTVRRFLEAD